MSSSKKNEKIKLTKHMITPEGVPISISTSFKQFAKLELNNLEFQNPDSTVLKFRKEIVSLCEKFDKSFGPDVPELSNTITKLLLHEPISDVNGFDNEWVEVSDGNGGTKFTNLRCSGLYKDSDGKCTYSKAIIFKDEEDDDDDFAGICWAYVDNTKSKSINSSQYVKFPFKPKTFYIDVVKVPLEESIFNTSDENYYYLVKDKSQLDDVIKYYDIK